MDAGSSRYDGEMFMDRGCCFVVLMLRIAGLG